MMCRGRTGVVELILNKKKADLYIFFAGSINYLKLMLTHQDPALQRRLMCYGVHMYGCTRTQDIS